jgi:hypothetical protein
MGALVVLVAIQLSVLGLYFPPVFRTPPMLYPPQAIFSAGPHCCVNLSASGRVGDAGGVQVSVPELYLPPVFG